MNLKHYLNFSDYSAADYTRILARAAQIKAEVAASQRVPRLAGRALFMLFEKPSTRTRASFAAAMAQAGGSAVELPMESLQLQRGESLQDTMRVLSAYCDVLMLRCQRHETLLAATEVAVCPVINGLSNLSHPCQALADVLTYQELRGNLGGKTIAWVGDCNNMLASWAEAAALFGARLQVACPPPYRRELPGAAFFNQAQEAAAGADLVMTDVWVSMGDSDVEQRRRAFAGYCVSAPVMAAAKKDALFMHCLPAHRGDEVAAEVIDGAQSAVWQQAENRLHAQKALVLHLLGIDD